LPNILTFCSTFPLERLKGKLGKYGSKPAIVVESASMQSGVDQINTSGSSVAESFTNSVRFSDKPHESLSKFSDTTTDPKPRSVKIGGEEKSEPSKNASANPKRESIKKNGGGGGGGGDVGDDDDDDDDDYPKRTWREFFQVFYEENFISPCHGDFGVNNGTQKSMTLKDVPGFEGFHPRSRFVVYWKFFLSCMYLAMI
jgi:hypothetical protein